MKGLTPIYQSPKLISFSGTLTAATRAMAAKTPEQAEPFAATLNHACTNAPSFSLDASRGLIEWQSDVRKALRSPLSQSLTELTGVLAHHDGNNATCVAELGLDIGIIVEASMLGLFEKDSYRDFRAVVLGRPDALHGDLRRMENCFGIGTGEKDTTKINRIDEWDLVEDAPLPTAAHLWDDEISAITSFDGSPNVESRRLITYDDIDGRPHDSDVDVLSNPLFPTNGEYVSELIATLKASGLSPAQTEVVDRMLGTYHEELERLLAAHGAIEREKYAEALLGALKADGRDETLFHLLSQLQDEQSGDVQPFID